MDPNIPHPRLDGPQSLRLIYRNWRGEVAARTILPKRIWYGQTDWHPESQWLLEAYDLEREAERSFALRDIMQFTVDNQEHVSDRQTAAGASG